MTCKLLDLSLWLSRIIPALNSAVPLLPLQFSAFLPKSSRLLACKHHLLNISGRLINSSPFQECHNRMVSREICWKSKSVEGEILLQFYINIQQCMDFCRLLVENTVFMLWNCCFCPQWCLAQVIVVLSKTRSIFIIIATSEVASVLDSFCCCYGRVSYFMDVNFNEVKQFLLKKILICVHCQNFMVTNI